MEKRTMNKLGVDMPLLGMGLMRLPMIEGSVDEAQALAMVSRMYDAGVRYFDTAYVYMNGLSEEFAKRALVERYPRDSFCLATKLPVGMVKEDGDAERVFSTSCERMGVDYVDFYLLHGINYEEWCLAKKNGSREFQKQLKADGRIRFAGFSFHGAPEELAKILDEDDCWDFVQLQINYYDWYNGTAKAQYDLVTAKGLPIIVMEPVRGGGLINLGEDIRAKFAAADARATNAEWAMRWIGSRPGVNVVLSGISTIEQAEENVNFFAPLKPISEAEEQTITQVVDIIKARPFVPCTGCNYCDVCPQGVNIPRTFHSANEYTRLNNKGSAMWSYYEATTAEHRADNCVACGLCVTKCPQGIDIPARLKECHELLTRLHEE